MLVHRSVGPLRFGDHRLDPRRRLVGRDQIVLELGQPVAHHLQRVAPDAGAVIAAGEVHRLQDALDDAAAVIGIEDVKPRPQAGALRFGAQLPSS